MVLYERMLVNQDINANRTPGEPYHELTPIFRSPGQMALGLVFGAAGLSLFGIAISAIATAADAGYTGLTYLMLLRPNGVPVYASLAVGTGCFLFIVLIWLMRDHKNWAPMAWAQIFVSIVAGVIIFSAQQFSATAVVGILAACFSGSTGFKRLMEIRAARKAAAATEQAAV